MKKLEIYLNDLACMMQVEVLEFYGVDIDNPEEFNSKPIFILDILENYGVTNKKKYEPGISKLHIYFSNLSDAAQNKVLKFYGVDKYDELIFNTEAIFILENRIENIKFAIKDQNYVILTQNHLDFIMNQINKIK